MRGFRRFEGLLHFEGGLLSRIERQAEDAVPLEACGVLLGDWVGPALRLYDVVPGKNLAPEKGRFFLDPLAWMEAEESGASCLIPWHSHPGGCLLPSKRDQKLFREHPLIGIGCLRDGVLFLELWESET
jgi:proteasome lid subunit RPN8/RPN11